MNALFETMRAVVTPRGAVVPLLPWHLERLLRGLRRLGVELPEPDVLHATVAAALVELRVDRVVRLSCPIAREMPRVRCELRDLVPPPTPLRLTILRTEAPGPDAALKCEPRALWLDLEQQARAVDADEPLTLRPDGTLGETSRGNLFAEQDGVILTPPADGTILPGVARELLLDRLRRRGIRCEERALTRESLRGARLWSSNAVHGPRAAVLLGEPASLGSDDLLRVAWSR